MPKSSSFHLRLEVNQVPRRQRGDEIGRHPPGILRGVEIVQDQRELIPAQACQKIGGAQPTLETGGRLDQQAVAGAVAEAVVF